MTESLLQLDDIDDVNLSYDEPRLLFLFNNTNTLGFAFPNRFNHTSVAFLSGAILFVLINTAFLMVYISSKRIDPEKKPAYDGEGNSKTDSNKKSSNEDSFEYDDYYDDYYYYEDMFQNSIGNSSTVNENPR